MHNDVKTLPAVSRRTLLKGTIGLSASTLLLGLPQNLLAQRTWVYTPTVPATGYEAGIVTTWYRFALQLIQQTPGFSPPVGARALGYLGVSLYEAAVPGMPGYRSLAGQLNGLTALPTASTNGFYWPAVVNSVLATSLRFFFPSASADNLAAIDDLEEALTNDMIQDVPPGTIRRSILHGKAVAKHIYEWSMDDGGHEGYARNFPDDYTPPTGAGFWVPTAPDYLKALQPYWGRNRPFVLESGASVDSGSHPEFSTESGSAFYSEAFEVYQAVENLTEEQRAIALYWSDDAGKTVTPPGHSISILTQLLEDRGADLATAAEAYAKAGIAVADAFISCWNVKYRYNLLRPISYIQQQIDPGWGLGERALPVTTPPFPEYSSGHSVQTAAFAHVVYDLFGDFPFTDHTHDARGLASRSFTSWRAMAEEAAISRLYGGIHYRSAIEHGIEQGREIGRRVGALRLRPSTPVPVLPDQPS